LGGISGIQLVLQTATIPPSIKALIFKAFGVTAYSVVCVSIAHPNIYTGHGAFLFSANLTILLKILVDTTTYHFVMQSLPRLKSIPS